MKPVYEERLISAFPSIYQALQPRFPGGERFECGDGWYGTVQELSAELEAISRLGGANRLRVVQVKEKLAALRVYFDVPAPATAIRLVDAAIESSRVTCELCGAPGNLRPYRGGLLKTLCGKCRPKRSLKSKRKLSQKGAFTPRDQIFAAKVTICQRGARRSVHPTDSFARCARRQRLHIFESSRRPFLSRALIRWSLR